MARKQNKVMAGVLTAAGAIFSMFGIRALVSWYRSRQNQQRYTFNDYTESVMVEEIPVTGNFDIGSQGVNEMPGAMDRTDMENMSDMQSNQSMQGMQGMPDTSDRPGMSPMPDDRDMRENMQGTGMPEAGITATGSSELGENTPGSYQSQQDQEKAIPATGGMETPAADMPATREQDRSSTTGQMEGNKEELDAESRFAAPVSDTDAAHRVNKEQSQVTKEPSADSPSRSEVGAENRSAGAENRPAGAENRSAGAENLASAPMGAASPIDQSIPVGSLVGPLVVHLLSFHNMINMLQQHKETSANVQSSANMPDVRAGGADAVSSLEGQVPQFDRSAMTHGSLQERMIQMMDRVRDALKNTDYSEDQLMQIDKDLRSEVCKVLDQIHQAQQDDVTGFEDVQKAYKC